MPSRSTDPTEQLTKIVAAVRDVLGDAALGAYLHGSTGTGRLRPDSDIDVLVVAARRLTPGEKRALIGRILPISGRGDPTGQARSVELAVVAAADVRPWHYPPPMELLYGDWWRRDFERPEFEAGEFEPWESPNPDLAPLITMVLQANRPVFGPQPRELLDPVPADDLRRAIVAGIPSLLGDLDTDTRNVILTFARIWTTLATGAIRSKDEAADWALERLPPEHRPALARARAIYLGDEPETFDDLEGRVRPAVDFVLAEIGRLAEG